MSLRKKNIPDGIAVSSKCLKDIWLLKEFEPEDRAVLNSVGRRQAYRPIKTTDPKIWKPVWLFWGLAKTAV
jgi:hypothetical protein